MKKSIKIFAVITTMAALLSSCSDWLNVLPENTLVMEKYWQTESDAKAVMAACYKGLTENDVVTRMIAWGELRSDNLSKNNTSNYDIQKTLLQEVSSTNSMCNWASYYKIINNCNVFLKLAPGVLKIDQNFTEDKLHRMEAEVLGIRALTYFYLVRAFKNVPLVLEPTIDDSKDFSVTQSPEKVVIDTIISDIKYALKYSVSTFNEKEYTLKSTKGRITTNALYALLADIYLWDGQYSECINACNKIMQDPNLELVTADQMLQKVFYEGNSSESIFELQYDDKTLINTTTRTFYGHKGQTQGAVGFAPNLAPGKQYSPFKYSLGSGSYESEKDYRSKDFFVTDATLGVYPVFKYAGQSRTESSLSTSSTYVYRENTSNWIIYRLPDIILMKAEALLHVKDSVTFDDIDDVVDLVNITYNRSNPNSDLLYSYNYPDVAEAEKLVYRERQRELMFEGKRWFDLVRLARRSNSTAPLVSYVAKTTAGNEALGKVSVMNALYWPVLESELLANKKLEQNPFYNTNTSK